MGAVRPTRADPFPPAAAWLLVAAAWLAAGGAWASGNSWIYNHHTLIEGHRFPWIVALGIFVLGWQLMTAAMMLPSDLASPRTGTPTVRRLAGFAAIWTLYALAAFCGDTGVHHLVDTWGWLALHTWVIAAGTLLLAGAYQFTAAKRRCLLRCAEPDGALPAGFGRGWRAGSVCLGCDWAMMLLMFGLGMGNPAWMAGLAAVMVAEKRAVGRFPLTSLLGLILVAWAILVATFPASGLAGEG